MKSAMHQWNMMCSHSLRVCGPNKNRTNKSKRGDLKWCRCCCWSLHSSSERMPHRKLNMKFLNQPETARGISRDSSRSIELDSFNECSRKVNCIQKSGRYLGSILMWCHGWNAMEKMTRKVAIFERSKDDASLLQKTFRPFCFFKWPKKHVEVCRETFK